MSVKTFKKCTIISRLYSELFRKKLAKRKLAKRKLAKRKLRMNWKAKIDAQTRKDAFAVLKWKPLVKAVPGINKTTIKSVKYDDITMGTLGKLNVFNAGIHRVKRVLVAKKKGVTDVDKLAAAAFPPKDRPRFGRDLSSVVYHATTTQKVSPIVIARWKKPDKKTQYILLDGVHRLVGVTIRGGRIRVAFLEL